jgi:hypothetical protein
MKRLTILRSIALLTLASIVLLSIVAVGAKQRLVRYSATKTYDTAESPLSGIGTPDPTCDGKGQNCRFAKDGYIDVGSVTFPPVGGIGKVTLAITITDSTRIVNDVNADVCQDTNGDFICGNTGDAQESGCFHTGKPRLLGGVDRGLPILVFIHAVWGCPTYLDDLPNGQAIATNGTVTLSGLIPASTPRTLKTIKHTFSSTIPCSQACSYNTPTLSDPLNPLTQDIQLACTAPSPPGSYSDLVVTAPPGANQIFITQTPRVDWDLFLCAKPKSGNNGAYIRKEWSDPHCLTFACKTTLSAPVVPGTRYVVRNFNVDESPSATIASTIQFRNV